MELKTYKQFKQGGETPPLLKAVEEKEVIEEEKNIYLLQHPDYEWITDGVYDPKDLNIELEDGFVKVDDKIKNILIDRGFKFIREVKEDE